MILLLSAALVFCVFLSGCGSESNLSDFQSRLKEVSVNIDDERYRNKFVESYTDKDFWLVLEAAEKSNDPKVKSFLLFLFGSTLQGRFADGSNKGLDNAISRLNKILNEVMLSEDVQQAVEYSLLRASMVLKHTERTGSAYAN